MKMYYALHCDPFHPIYQEWLKMESHYLDSLISHDKQAANGPVIAHAKLSCDHVQKALQKWKTTILEMEM